MSNEHILVSRGTFDELHRKLGAAAVDHFAIQMLTIEKVIVEVEPSKAKGRYDLPALLRTEAAGLPLLLTSPPQPTRMASLLSEAATTIDHLEGYRVGHSSIGLTKSLQMLIDVEEATATEADATEYGAAADYHQARANILKAALTRLRALETPAADPMGAPV